MNVNDLKLTALAAVAGTNITEKWRTWLTTTGGVTDTGQSLMDIEMEYLDGKLVTAGHINDRWYEYLGSLGRTGALADRWLQQWAVGPP